jgi:hypothetical protein
MNRLRIEFGFALIFVALSTGFGDAAYANWFGSLLGALTGASRLARIAGAVTAGRATSEAGVSLLLRSRAVTALAGAAP